jgi:hypothetical protein
MKPWMRCRRYGDETISTTNATAEQGPARPAKQAPVEPPQEERRHRNRGHHDEPRRSRLAQQQRRDEGHHREHRQEALAEIVHERGLAHRVVGGVEHHEELHQLRGLEGREAERDPAARAVHLAPDAGNEQHDQHPVPR